MLRKKSAFLLAALLWIAGCQPPPPPHRVEVGPGNPNTPAGEAGKLAYKMEKETEKAAKEASKKIDQAARDAHAGYSNAAKHSDK